MPAIDPTKLIEAGPTPAPAMPSISDTLPVKLDTAQPNTEAEADPETNTDEAQLSDEIQKEEQRAAAANKLEDDKVAAKTIQENTGENDNQSQPEDDTPPTARRNDSSTTVSGGDEEDKDWTKFKPKMAKEAGQWVEARLKENQSLKTEVKKLKESLPDPNDKNALPPAWYEHPEAYNLAPEYKQGQQVLNHLGAVLAHYQEQLINIEEGDPWVDLRLDAQGNLYKADPVKPDGRARATVLDRMANARQQISNQSQYLQNYVANFQQRNSVYGEGMKKVEDHYFPQYKDAKSLEKDKHYHAIKKTLVDNGLANDRMAGLVSKLYVYTMEIQTENAKLKKESDKASTLKDLQRRAGPTGSMINNGSSNVNGGDLDDVPFDPKVWDKIRQQ